MLHLCESILAHDEILSKTRQYGKESKFGVIELMLASDIIKVLM